MILKVSEDDNEVGYLYLQSSSKGASKQVSLTDLVGEYNGPTVYFDFDEDNVLLGIEIVG